jgi:transaldolase
MNPLQQLLNDKTTNIFLDSGDPAETAQTLELLGHLDGQTTNPSLIAKSPQVQEFLKSQKFTRGELFEKYHQIALQIRQVIPAGKISAEVYADANSTVNELLEQAYQIAQWFPEIFVKLPITTAGLSAAEQLVADGISVNMTLCFSQDQAAAVHAATKDAKNCNVYVSPFIGRLDDIGQNGPDVIANIQNMYNKWGSHVGVLGASIRNVEHIQFCIDQKIAAMTIPLKILTTLDQSVITEINNLESIPYQELEQKDWEDYNIEHELTTKGLEKFAADWNALCE